MRHCGQCMTPVWRWQDNWVWKSWPKGSRTGTIGIFCAAQDAISLKGAFVSRPMLAEHLPGWIESWRERVQKESLIGGELNNVKSSRKTYPSPLVLKSKAASIVPADGSRLKAVIANGHHMSSGAAFSSESGQRLDEPH